MYIDNKVQKSYNDEQDGNFNQGATLRENIYKALGLKNNAHAEANDLLRQMGTVKKTIGTFKNAIDKTVTLVMTKSNAMNYYCLMQNPKNISTFADGMHWTTEMMAAVSNSLTVKEKSCC